MRTCSPASARTRSRSGAFRRTSTP
jgi:hypothetical protein